MDLPCDDFILLSLINTALRDGDTLEDFCAQRQCGCEEVKARLLRAGYFYDEENNAFKGI